MFSIFMFFAGKESFSRTTSPIWLLLKELKKIGPSHIFSNSLSCSLSNLESISMKKILFEFLSLLINYLRVLNSLVRLLQYQPWTHISPLFNRTQETSNPTYLHLYTPLQIWTCIFVFLHIFTPLFTLLYIV